MADYWTKDELGAKITHHRDKSSGCANIEVGDHYLGNLPTLKGAKAWWEDKSKGILAVSYTSNGKTAYGVWLSHVNGYYGYASVKECIKNIGSQIEEGCKARKSSEKQSDRENGKKKSSNLLWRITKWVFKGILSIIGLGVFLDNNK